MPLSVVHDELDKIEVQAISATELREAVKQDPNQVQILYCKKGKESRPETRHSTRVFGFQGIVRA